MSPGDVYGVSRREGVIPSGESAVEKYKSIPVMIINRVDK